MISKINYADFFSGMLYCAVWLVNMGTALALISLFSGWRIYATTLKGTFLLVNLNNTFVGILDCGVWVNYH